VTKRGLLRRFEPRRVLVVVAVLGLLGIGISACGAVSTAKKSKVPVVKVGALVSLTGPAAVYGVEEDNTLKSLVARYNSKSSETGFKVDLITYDDQSEPSVAASGIEQLVSDGVSVVIGSSTGSDTLAALPLAARSHVPMLAPVSSIAVTDHSASYFPWAFRSIAGQNVTTLAKFKAMRAAHVKSVGIFYQDDAFGQGSEAYLSSLLKGAHIPVTATASVPDTANSAQTEAEKIVASKPQVIDIQSFLPTVAAPFVQEVRALGYSGPIWASGALAQQAFLTAVGGAGNGMILWTTAINWFQPLPSEMAWMASMEKAGDPVNGFAQIDFTHAWQTVADALQVIRTKHETVSGTNIRDAIEGLCGPGVDSGPGPGVMCYSKTKHSGWGAASIQPSEIVSGKLVDVTVAGGKVVPAAKA